MVHGARHRLIDVYLIFEPHPQRQPAFRFPHTDPLAEGLVQAGLQGFAAGAVFLGNTAQMLLLVAIIDQVREHLLRDRIGIAQHQCGVDVQGFNHISRCNHIAAAKRRAEGLG